MTPCLCLPLLPPLQFVGSAADGATITLSLELNDGQPISVA